jgi:protein gp37
MTTIEWVRNSDGSEGMSWNALRAVRIDENGKRRSANHCEHVNEACRNCYADGLNARLGGLPFKPGHRKDYTFEIDERKLLEPLRCRKPTRIFVESMSDAFGEWWPDHFIDKLYAVMARCPQHTFINLSKRPERRRDYLAKPTKRNDIELAAERIGPSKGLAVSPKWCFRWPLPNVIEGTSASNQDEANEFGNSLFRTQAAIRVLSLEPLLGPIDIREISTDGVGSAAGNKLSDVLGHRRRRKRPQGAPDASAVGARYQGPMQGGGGGVFLQTVGRMGARRVC